MTHYVAAHMDNTGEWIMCSRIYWTEKEAHERAKRLSKFDPHLVYRVFKIEIESSTDFKAGKKMIL